MLLRKVNLIQLQCKRIEDNVAALIQLTQEKSSPSQAESQPTFNQDFDRILNILPIDREEDMDVLEFELTDSDQFNSMVKYLANKGGQKLPEAVRRMLKATMTNKLAAHYSWIGFKKKKVFSSLHLKDVIFKAVNLNKSLTECSEADIENTIKTWLKYAKARSEAKHPPA